MRKLKQPKPYKSSMAESVKMPKQIAPLPNISFEETQLPEIKGWEVGQTYTITMQVKMVSKRQGEEWGPMDGADKKVRASFKVIGVETKGNKKINKSSPVEDSYDSRAQ